MIQHLSMNLIDSYKKNIHDKHQNSNKHKPCLYISLDLSSTTKFKQFNSTPKFTPCSQKSKSSWLGFGEVNKAV